jgi:hypothetical protein
MNRSLKATQRKLESMELEHLRQFVTEISERAERAEEELDRAWESANFWQRFAMDQQDDDCHTHRQIGITQTGELIVVRAAQ